MTETPGGAGSGEPNGVERSGTASEAVDGPRDWNDEPVIVRVYSDADGLSRFEEIRIPGGRRRSDVSTSVAWWSEKMAVRNLVWRRVEEEAPSTTPHNAPRRQLIVPLSGAVEIEVGTGERRTIPPGQIILVEDTTGTGHITRAADDATRVTLMLELGDEDLFSQA